MTSDTSFPSLVKCTVLRLIENIFVGILPFNVFNDEYILCVQFYNGSDVYSG